MAASGPVVTKNTDSDAEDRRPSKKQLPAGDKRFLILTLWGLLATGRSILNMLSCSYTLAYNIALVESLTPVLAPLLERLFLKTPLPKNIFAMLTLSIFGCIIVAFSQSPYYYAVFGSTESTYNWTMDDMVGLTMQLFSVLCLNLARIVMKTSEGIMSPTEGIQIQNVLTIFTSVIISMSTGGGAMWTKSLGTLFSSLPVVAAFLFLTLGILSGALLFEITVVRHLGPGAYGSLTSIRVPVAVLGSYAILSEPVQNWLEWIGIFIIVVTMAMYVAKRRSEGGGEGDDDGDNGGDDEVGRARTSSSQDIVLM